jgi:hypothetical protein
MLKNVPRYNELKEMGDCLYCFSKIINEIIKRKFYKCYRCFCCVGDDCFDNYDVYECNVNNNNTYIEFVSKNNNLENNEELEF